MSQQLSKYEGYSHQSCTKNSRVICQQHSEIPTFEGYLVTYLQPCELGVKNEGYKGEGYTYLFISCCYFRGL